MVAVLFRPPPTSDSDLLGMITLAGRGQDDAANAAVKWIRDHCAANDLELVRVENFNDRYPEEQRSDFSLTRFTITRSESPGRTAGRYRRGCRPQRPGPHAGLEGTPEGGVNAPSVP